MPARTAVSRGTDAEAGTRAIARCGGTVFTQDQASSESFVMPGATISTALVHKILALPDIAPAIHNHVTDRTQ